MPRRPHKKSRAGCQRCKKRHIKCDEHRPRCINCQTAGLDCSFAPDGPAAITPVSQQHTPATSNISTPEQPRQTKSQTTVIPKFTPLTSSDSALNMQHLELLHQFTTNTCTSFSDIEDMQEVWRTIVVRMALSFPFLMYELLAMSALHLAFLRPESSALYYTKSTELQTLGLTSFNNAPRDVDASNCAPILIFTTLLGVHVLADPTRATGLDAHHYLDHVIHCIMLMKNVRKLVIHDWYDYLRESELKPMFVINPPSPTYQLPQPCLDLLKLTEDPDLNEQAREAYRPAIERLHWIYATSNVPNRTHTTVRWVLAWPVQLDAAYQNHLDQRRPEALVILSYFAVLLLFYKESWIVGDSGQLMIKAIASHLGPHWSAWMEWPLSFVNGAGTDQG